jgi:molecular chaperone HscB
MSVDLKQNYFALFGLPVSYNVDRAMLDQRYRELQRLVHPDKFASAADQERRIAMQQAAQINEGYRVLKDELARARYVLELRGHRFDDERNTHQDPEFLMEQMELREALGDVREAADPVAAVSGILEQVDARLAALGAELDAELAADAAIPEPALMAVQRMQFFRKLAQEAQELEADLDDEAG